VRCGAVSLFEVRVNNQGRETVRGVMGQRGAVFSPLFARVIGNRFCNIPGKLFFF
jgi:hypothetical protein